MSLSRILYDIFFADSTHYSTGYVKANGEKGFSSIEGVPTLEQIDDHQQGDIVLGAYTVIPGDTVRWCAWDIDASTLEEARELSLKISEFLTEHGIPHAIGFSGNRGYHIYIFFKEKEPAEEVLAAGIRVREILGLPKNGSPHVEFFPKQGKLTEKNPLGSLIRVPLGAHPATRVLTYFVDTVNWEDGDPLDAENIFSQKTTLSVLQKAISESDPFDQIVELLAPYWEAGQRHDISLYVSGFFAHTGWIESDVCTLIEAIHNLVPEGDLTDQIKTVESTFKKYASGGRVIGYAGLVDILPTSTLNRLLVLAGSSSASPILQAIDSIRLGKNPSFLKVRNAALACLMHFTEKGRLVRDNNHTVYWLENSSHKLTAFDSYDWDRLLHNQLGINLSESFGRQVSESINHFCYDKAAEVSIYKRSHWSSLKEKLYINVGGSEIYVLCGDWKKAHTIYNGETDVLFKNQEDTMHLADLFAMDIEPVSPWSLLVDDLNFKEDIETTPVQQREMLKALICAFFFGETMPTRPILAILADSGSGKTSCARRILWLMEGYNQDVLGQTSDKPDALRASMAAHKIVVLDNLEQSKASGLPDTLNRAATGSQIELRQLHTTNKVQKITIDVYVVLTATEMPFSEETVYTRILPIQLAPLKISRPEAQIRADIIDNFNALWKGLLRDLDKVVAELNKVKEAEIPSQSRLADFYVFCQRIKDVDFIDGKELMNGLDSLINRQKEILKQNSPFIDVLETLLRTHTEEMEKWMSISELFARGQRSANMNRQEWRWTASAGLSRHLGALEAQLIQYYGMSVRDGISSGRKIKEYKFEKTKTVFH